MSSDGDKEKVPYFTYAFHNPYNYAFMGGIGAAAVLNQNWWLLVLGGGLEALWMLFGPDSRLLRAKWFDKVHDEKKRALADAAWRQKLMELPLSEGERVARLEHKRHDILRLVGENKAFTASLLKNELAKLDRLLTSFADLAVSTHRYETYLDQVDLRTLEADIRRYEDQLKGNDADEQRRELAQKNLAVLMKRRDKLTEIKSFVRRARSQMELIENSFELLTDQIVTMRSPQELDGQLDELIDGVEAVRTTARETEALLEAVAQ